MFIVKNTSKHKSGKVYHSVLLRQSYREDGKVKKRTIANLSNCTEEEINAINHALKNKSSMLTPNQDNDFEIIQGRSIGSVHVLHTIAERLGIIDALGSSYHAKLALWLVIARILEQGSRLSATRLDGQYDIASVIGLNRGFDENNLYECLHWLTENQNKIEDFLFNRKKQSHKFYWYDVTSSYLEGIHNELAFFGYDRDKKKRKRIIVVGLLCQDQGEPISIEVFKGNTQDTQTFESQVLKLKNRFGCESITIVSDRGLIREKQKKLLNELGLHYVTALPMPQILSVIHNGLVQLEDFKEDLRSFYHDGRRYIYRRNPDRALETRHQRQERFETAQRKVDQENQRLEERLKASSFAARRRIQKVLKRLCIFEWVVVTIEKRRLVLTINEERLKKKSELDGCYIWTTDLTDKEASDREIFERYKDLKYIEDDFRTFKTNFLEVRPIFVRSEESTRGHLVVVMLAHMILRELRTSWSHFNKTVEEILNELSFLCRQTIQYTGGKTLEYIPRPNENMNALLSAVNVTMPNSIQELKVKVVTRHKVRKSVTV